MAFPFCPSLSVGCVLAQKGRGLVLWGRVLDRKGSPLTLWGVVSEQEGCGLTLFFPFFRFLGWIFHSDFLCLSHLGFFCFTILITLSVCGWEAGAWSEFRGGSYTGRGLKMAFFLNSSF